MDHTRRVAASRRVLEVRDSAKRSHMLTIQSLYRAATLTFHSTSVLRHLFTVHTTLAEFDLAEKALDSYVGIVMKGKARVEKSGVAEPDLDSDEEMLLTIAGGIESLCEFGKRKQVEKSVALAGRLTAWLDQHQGSSKDQTNGASPASLSEVRQGVADQVYAFVYRAIAISKASWARLTYDSDDRSKLRSDAIKHLKDALRIDRIAEEDPSFLYPLALIYAENRNIEAAVAVVKAALSASSRTFTEPLDRGSIVYELKERTTTDTPIVECWHLLLI